MPTRKHNGPADEQAEQAPVQAEQEFVLRAGGWGLRPDGVWVQVDAEPVLSQPPTVAEVEQADSERQA